jgi:hypothetical protein
MIISILTILITTISVTNIGERITGNLVLDINREIVPGDNLSGFLKINLNSEDIKKDYPILFFISKNDTILTAETLTLSELIKDPKKISNTYVIKLEDLMDYNFEESGEYESLFSIFELNLHLKETFIVN